MSDHDAINHPAHYTEGKYECIEFIESHRLNFHLGNAVKYITRAGKKDPAKKQEDLKKALWYLKRHILCCRDWEPIHDINEISPDQYGYDKGLNERLRVAVAYIVGGRLRIAAELIEQEVRALEDH